eukprot:GCRY01000508.1.p1 GENE.GCRY01000508.1~~GCRY01000508.1.p1  ORF type:complete len:477 (-),score=69.24 GCRY01000508.1:456-1886(-)
MEGGEKVKLISHDAAITTSLMSIWRLLAISCSCIGIQFSYAVQFILVTPQLERLGVPDGLVPVVWLAGPLSGLLVQPIIGVRSDKCTHKWGRRRIFILWGAVFTFIGMITLGLSEPIGHLVLPSNYKLPAIICTVLGLYILNFAINVMQGPCRTLITDLVPQSQQQMANALCSFMMACANVICNFAGSFNIVNLFPFFKTNYIAMFIFSVFFLILSVTITLLCSHETPLQLKQKEADVDSKEPNVLAVIWKAARNMPGPLLRLGIVYAFCWMAYNPFQLYLTHLFGKEVYHGDPHAKEHTHSYDAYQKGVRMGALGMTFNALVAMSTAPFQSSLVRIFGVRTYWSLSELIASACLILPSFFLERDAVLSFSAVIGVNFVAFNAIPFALLRTCTKEEDRGVYMGVLNAFAVTAQTFTNFVAGSLFMTLFDTTAAALATGGGFAILAAISVWVLIRPVDYSEKDELHERSPLINAPDI